MAKCCCVAVALTKYTNSDRVCLGKFHDYMGFVSVELDTECPEKEIKSHDGVAICRRQFLTRVL